MLFFAFAAESIYLEMVLCGSKTIFLQLTVQGFHRAEIHRDRCSAALAYYMMVVAFFPAYLIQVAAVFPGDAA
jgi:hypothetical protein